MSDQSLAQLLKEARDFDDYRKVADELERRFASNEELSKAFINAASASEVDVLRARVRDLEDQLRGSASDQSFHSEADPRPPTRLGDEFPEPFGPRRPVLECNQCGSFPMRNDLLREHHQIGDRCPAGGLDDYDCDGTLQKPGPEKEPAPNPPSKAVRVDSLPVGAKCWVEATVVSTDDGDAVDLATNCDSFSLWNHVLVLPVEPTPKPEPAEPPKPLQLQVGHRYRLGDDTVTVCTELTGSALYPFRCCAVPGVLGRDYTANGELFVNEHHHLNIVEDLGPVEPVKPRPAWATEHGADWSWLNGMKTAAIVKAPKSSVAEEYWRRIVAVCDGMLAELEEKPRPAWDAATIREFVVRVRSRASAYGIWSVSMTEQEMLRELGDAANG